MQLTVEHMLRLAVGKQAQQELPQVAQELASCCLVHPLYAPNSLTVPAVLLLAAADDCKTACHSENGSRMLLPLQGYDMPSVMSRTHLHAVLNVHDSC